jgi:hypothetical protein
MATEWSAKDDKRLRLLYEAWEGDVIPVAAIAQALKRTPGAVRYRASTLGLSDASRPKAGRGRKAADVKRECANCGTEFTLRSPSSDQQTCSRSCSSSLTAKRRGQAGRGRFSGGKSKAGKRADLGDQFFRSAWEANYARYLNHLISEGAVERWEFEPQPFFFPVKRGNKGYLPDFRVWYPDGSYEWHEVKGYMDDASRIKLKRFALHHTGESLKLKLIDRAAYMAIKAEFENKLEGWE